MNKLKYFLIAAIGLVATGITAIFLLLPPGGIGGGMLLWRVMTEDPGRPGAGPEVIREVGGWTGRGGVFRQGDIYRLRGTSEAVLVMIPGGTPQGRDDLRLQTAARALARTGFVVLVPEISNFRRLRVEASDVALIGDAILAAADLPEGRRVGMIAASYALPATIKAALAPETRELVGMIVGIGGVYDSVATARHLLTGGVNPLSTWGFLQIHADLVSDAADRTTLAAIAGRRLSDPAAPIDDLSATLGPEGSAILALATARDPQGFDDAFSLLPIDLARRLGDIGLAETALDELRARVILVHGNDDPIVPPTESDALAQALRPGQTLVVRLNGLVHADPADLGWQDMQGALGAAAALMHWRDAGE